MSLYLAHLTQTKDERRARYVEQAEQMLRDYVLPRWERLEQVTAPAWTEAVREIRAGQTRRKKPPMWATLQRATVAVRRFLAWCLTSGYLTTAPVLRAPPHSLAMKEQAARRALTEVERDKILRKLVGEARRWYLVAFYTAMRRGEIAALASRWVDFKHATVRIPADVSKGAREGLIDLHPIAAQAIRAQMKARGKIGADAPLFGDQDHRKAWWSAVDAAGVDRAGLTANHTARHTRLTQIAAAGGKSALLAVMAQARHRSITTSQKYLHAQLEHARKANRRAR